MRKKTLLVTLACLIVIITILGGCTSENTNEGKATAVSPNEGKTEGNEPEKFEEVTLQLLTNWNGASTAPKDQINNPVAQIIREKTGVTLEIMEVKISEVEKLNAMFAIQDFPDIYAGPAWMGGGEMETILKGVKGDMFLDLTDYLKRYPNLAKSVQKESVPLDMYNRYLDPEQFGGKSYMLYTGMPATSDDGYDWLYGFYVRKDITQQLNVDPQSIRTKDDLYDFLNKIKDAKLTENGKDIFPLGAFHGGWPLGLLSKMFYNNAGWQFNEDGTVQHNFMTQANEEAILFTRKLISEGLLDPEAFLQSEAIANEKIAQGRYAVLPGHFYYVNEATGGYVKDNPNGEFIPLGPLDNSKGDPYKSVFRAQGHNINLIPKTSKDPEAAARVIDFLSSDEGYLLTHYGVEGVHYDMVDGKPSAKAEWVEKMKADPKALLNEGIAAGYATLSGPDRQVSLGGGTFGHEADPKNAIAQEYKKMIRPNGVEIATGSDPQLYAISTDMWQSIKPVADGLAEITQQAYYAKSEEDAKKLIETGRSQMEKAGIHKIEEMIAEQHKITPFIDYLDPN
ncbi:extracellular solute-binding protein [Paenibacillus sp. strain BS8-2]